MRYLLLLLLIALPACADPQADVLHAYAQYVKAMKGSEKPEPVFPCLSAASLKAVKAYREKKPAGFSAWWDSTRATLLNEPAGAKKTQKVGFNGQNRAAVLTNYASKMGNLGRTVIFVKQSQAWKVELEVPKE